MPLMIIDPREIAEAKARRAGAGDQTWDEVWDGVEVMPPMANNEHQEIQLGLGVPLYDTIQVAGLGRVFGNVNVSDRGADWLQNYRIPDAVVYLNGNPAVNHGEHWEGGPDFLVEIMSPGEDSHAKFTFYAGVNTREILIVDRYPWALELYTRKGRRFRLAGRSDLANPAVLASGVVPLTFQLQPGTARPRIAVRHTGSGQAWMA
jgi:Uma2 family endonuclease